MIYLALSPRPFFHKLFDVITGKKSVLVVAKLAYRKGSEVDEQIKVVNKVAARLGLEYDPLFLPIGKIELEHETINDEWQMVVGRLNLLRIDEHPQLEQNINKTLNLKG